MIYNLFTSGQWLVIWVVVWLLSATVIEILLYRDRPWYTRTRVSDVPPIFGGVVLGFLTCVAVAGVLGAIHGLTWVWIYG